jgi:hypothetical protein
MRLNAAPTKVGHQQIGRAEPYCSPGRHRTGIHSATEPSSQLAPLGDDVVCEERSDTREWLQPPKTIREHRPQTIKTSELETIDHNNPKISPSRPN